MLYVVENLDNNLFMIVRPSIKLFDYVKKIDVDRNFHQIIEAQWNSTDLLRKRTR